MSKKPDIHTQTHIVIGIDLLSANNQIIPSEWNYAMGVQ